MFTQVRVIGRGRVGTAIHARLTERGLAAAGPDADLILLCVPDAAIAGAAATVQPGPWIAHVSGATPPNNSTAPGGAVTGDSDAARAHGHWLAECLGLRPFDIRDESRVLYHAGAAMASNFLVTLYRAASRLLEHAGAPPEALLPLMRRTIDNGFELTGPIARGDWTTVDAHLAAIQSAAPELEALYRAMAQVTRP
jgi:predicted short-subunit dehydrogenase-like oxidoreductase (DUF2520 family)